MRPDRSRPVGVARERSASPEVGLPSSPEPLLLNRIEECFVTRSSTAAVRVKIFEAGWLGIY
jgi:hypothetical protein